jgi:anti-sigma factor RsiW
MSRCPENTQWVLYAADELPPRTRRALEAHLARCEACRREAASVARGMTALAALDREPPVPAQAMETLRRRLRVAAAHKVAQPSILAVIRPYRWAAAAAIILLAAFAWMLVPPPVNPAVPTPWISDVQVQEEIAEITVGVEMLESSMNGLTADAAPVRPQDADDPALDDLDQFLEGIWAEINA